MPVTRTTLQAFLAQSGAFYMLRVAFEHIFFTVEAERIRHTVAVNPRRACGTAAFVVRLRCACRTQFCARRFASSSRREVIARRD